METAYVMEVVVESSFETDAEVETAVGMRVADDAGGENESEISTPLGSAVVVATASGAFHHEEEYWAVFVVSKCWSSNLIASR